MISSTTLRKLIEAGLEGGALIAIVESMEADMARPKSSGAARQKRYRDAHRNVTRNVTDTPPPFVPPDKETPPEPPKEINPPIIPQPRGRGSRLPNDFEPDLVFATGLGLSFSQAQTESAKFRDFWLGKTGQNATKADWPATWRNWARRAAESQPRGSPKRGTAVDVLNVLSDRIEDAKVVQEPGRSNFDATGGFPGVPQRSGNGSAGLSDGDRDLFRRGGVQNR